MACKVYLLKFCIAAGLLILSWFKYQVSVLTGYIDHGLDFHQEFHEPVDLLLQVT